MGQMSQLSRIARDLLTDIMTLESQSLYHNLCCTSLLLGGPEIGRPYTNQLSLAHCRIMFRQKAGRKKEEADVVV